MSKYGDIEHDEEWDTEPLEKYLSYKKERAGITDHRYEDIKRGVAQSPESVEHEAWDEAVDWRDGATVDDAWDFLSQLRDAGLSERTVEDRMRVVQSFLSELMERSSVVESNPVAFVCDEANFESEEKGKIERSVKDVGAYLQGIENHQLRAIGLMLVKTGIRSGEAQNIDLPYLHLDSDAYYQLLDAHGVTLDSEIREQPDTLYIPSEPTVGESWRGEERQAGNKRKRGTVIPVDGELKHALLDWLAQRPATEYPHPLWVRPGTKPKRIGKNALNRRLCNKWAERTGFVDDGSTGEFTPHWFRHFFTTQMKPGMGHHNKSLDPSLVKFIRGDVEDDIMAVYTHSWGDQVKQQYLDNIYQFGIYD